MLSRSPSPVPSGRRRSFAPGTMGLPALFLLAGMGLMAAGIRLGAGVPHQPGPGLWPCLVGAGLIASGLLTALPGETRTPRPASPARADRRSLVGLAAACGVWIALLLPLGWIPATAAALFAACRGARNSAAESAVLILLLTGGLYAGVERLLNWPLPSGDLLLWISAPGRP